MGHTINSEEFNALRLKLEQASKIVIVSITHLFTSLTQFQLIFHLSHQL